MNFPPLLGPAYACTDLHSELAHLNTGETIQLSIMKHP